MNWSDDRLAHFAEVESSYWPSVYLAPNLLNEAVWFAIHYAR